MYVNKGNTAAAEPIIADIPSKDRRNTVGLKLRAAIKIEQGQFDSAIADLREALNDQPKSADLLMLMAAAYERSGKNELAERQYADALKASGLNPSIALRYVAFLQRRGDFTRRCLKRRRRAKSGHPAVGTLAQIVCPVRTGWRFDQPTPLRAGDKADRRPDPGSAFAGQNTDESVAALEKAHAAAPMRCSRLIPVSTMFGLEKLTKRKSATGDVKKISR